MKYYRVFTGAIVAYGVLILPFVAAASVWQVPNDFETIQEALDSNSVVDGDFIFVGRGEHSGAIVTKAVGIVGLPGAVITDGPVLAQEVPCHGDLNIGFRFGFQGDPPGSGATIRNFAFKDVAFPVFSRGADGVKVISCQMSGAVQGITNVGGTNWQIVSNTITQLRAANGGGIGILVGDRYARPGGVKNNRVYLNSILGTLSVSSCETGGYNGSGILLYADYRWDGLGAESIENNIVQLNYVSVMSESPETVDIVGIELTDTREDTSLDPVIVDNYIILNRLIDLSEPFKFAPETVQDENVIRANRTNESAAEPTVKMMKTVRSSSAIYF